MEKISVARPSSRAMSRLKKGEKVRLMKGEGLDIFIEPEKINKASKSFLKGKGIQMNLSPAEIAHNEGCGAFKKVKRMAINTAKKMGRQTIKHVAPEVADKFGAVLGAVAPAVLGNPELSPLGAMMGQQMGEAGAKYLTDNALSALRTSRQNRRNEPRSRGTGIDPLGRANLGVAHADMESANIERMRARVMDDQSPFPVVGAHHEKSSINVGGNLLKAGQALQSQPFSANFQFRHTLPPSFQNISKRGGSLYAQSGRGGSLGGSLGAGLYAQPSSARGLYA
jgi:hypothetical protein